MYLTFMMAESDSKEIYLLILADLLATLLITCLEKYNTVNQGRISSKILQ